MVTEEDLKVGTKIRIGKEYSEFSHGEFQEGEVIELIEGYFDYENGLYVETQTAPSIKIQDEPYEEWSSIYHLFGNHLEDFKDCEIVQ